MGGLNLYNKRIFSAVIMLLPVILACNSSFHFSCAHPKTDVNDASMYHNSRFYLFLSFLQALIWSKMSTGLPIEITSSMKSQNYTSFCRLDIDIHKYEMT